MNIEPITITSVKTVNNFVIDDIKVELNKYAIVQVLLKNGDEYVMFESLKLEGDDYANWGSYDQYIIDYVRNYITSKYT